MPLQTAPFAPRAGGVLSADIAVPEHEREVRFHARVLGTGAEPLWREDLMNNQGTPIIGLGERVPAYEDLPLQWMPHIQVPDVGASAARAVELGGTEVLHGKDDAGQSLWAGLLDPQGAAFGLIPVVSAEECPAVADDVAAGVGRIAWIDLTVADVPAAVAFYREVIGWTAREGDGPDGGTTLLAADGAPAAGIRPAAGGREDLPTIWLHHLPVGDLAESLRRVADEGGQVLHQEPGPDGAPLLATIRDPVGACLTLVQA